jgi:hypothetical protein
LAAEAARNDTAMPRCTIFRIGVGTNDLELHAGVRGFAR